MTDKDGNENNESDYYTSEIILSSWEYLKTQNHKLKKCWKWNQPPEGNVILTS